MTCLCRGPRSAHPGTPHRKGRPMGQARVTRAGSGPCQLGPGPYGLAARPVSHP